MALTPGTQLGPYEIISPLGAGGMGEVYRAKDTRLDREVAIKVLPSHLAANRELKQRLDREAKTISQLSHPNICTLYDIGSEDGVDFLVMEYLEGETLAHRIGKGRLPIEDVLRYSTEIASALDKAHRAGVVHRDLKPGNIMLTKEGAKLLDFGLAKTAAGRSGLSTAPDAPTLTEPLTSKGTIVGTFQYMAPEQLEGKEADARTDIFAFGAVLYEMATGKRAFEGASRASLIASIMSAQPRAISELQPMTPPALDHLVQNCLAKDADERIQTAHDVKLQLKWIAEGGSQIGAHAVDAAADGVRALPWALVGVLAVSVGVALWALSRGRTSAPRPVTRLVVPLPTTARLEVETWRPAVALSADGRRLVYVANRSGKLHLYLRELDQLEATPIPGTEGGYNPFFSPDGQWVGFFTWGKLKKVSLMGGAPAAIGDVTPVTRGASWGSDDTIIHTTDVNGGLVRLSAVADTLPPDAFSDAPLDVLGGQALTTPDPTRGEFGHRWPQFLPSGKAVLFTIDTGGSFDDAKIAVLSLETRETKILFDGGTNARYSPTGHIVFAREGSLLAVSFDLERLEVTGSPVTILKGVMMEPGGAAHFSLSEEGSLVYVPGGVLVPERTLVWVNRQGQVEPLPTPTREYTQPSLSPDGRRLAVTIRDGSNYDVWISEVVRGTLTPLTTHPQEDVGPIWTRDGRRVTFASEMAGSWPTAWWRLADGSGPPEPLLAREEGKAGIPSSWSLDGQTLAFFNKVDSQTGYNIWMLSPDGEGEPEAFLRTEFDESWAMFSPDGRWIAYVSNESGQDAVYVRPYPGPGGKVPISVGGGTEPVWAPDGRELFYRNGDRMMAVAIETEPEFSAGTPRLLFEGQFLRTGPRYAQRNYDISPDGKRFLMIKREHDVVPTKLIVVLNWFEELKRLVPTGVDE